MRHLLLPLLALALVLPTACTTVRHLDGSAPLLDSLRSENATLRAQLRQTEDSLQFYDDLSTGQYYRDLRMLNDRLNRMTYEVRALRDGGQTVRLLPADSLFKSGTVTLSSVGAKQLRSVVARLETTYPARTVRVEGHTDDVALGPAFQKQFGSNWELSSARAATVVRHLVEKSTLDPAQFVAVGYGATDPVATNETGRGRRQNRRVRIAVLPIPRDYSRPFETTW